MILFFAAALSSCAVQRHGCHDRHAYYGDDTRYF
jgi:hypothetical protein